MYIGNDLQVAESGNKIIDDISSSFNGSTTSFALTVGGYAPVPFPINTQQIYISVNGVIQEPDPSGSAGFKLLGTNIVFSSAPASGHAFFGVILSGADYVTVGTEFPAGSATSPSITFGTDNDTGMYSVTAGTMGFTSNGVQTFTLDGDAFRFNDGKKLICGTGSDMEVYHSGSHSFITNSGGDLVIGYSNVYIQPVSGENGLRSVANGTTELYYDAVLKIATTSGGVNVTGTVTDDGATHDGDVTFTGASANAVWDKSADDLIFNDNAKAAFGTSSDLQLFHDGTHSRIYNSTGNLSFKSSAYYFNNAAGTENCLDIVQNGAVSLYYDNTKRLETTSIGIEATGHIFSTTKFRGNDDVKVSLGTSEDLQLYHGSNTNWIETHNDHAIKITKGANSELLAQFTPDGAVDLYFNNSKKFQTTSAGCGVTGDLTFADSGKAIFGAGDDLQIYHDGGNSWLKEVGTGALYVDTNGSVIKITHTGANETMAAFYKDGAAELYHNNFKCVKTDTNGAYIYGPQGDYASLFLFADEGDQDSDKWFLKAHDSSSIFQIINQNSGSNEVSIECNGDGNVELYYDGSRKVYTTTNGLVVHSGTPKLEVYADTDDVDATLVLIGKTPSGGVGQAGRVEIVGESTATNNGSSAMHLRTRKSDNNITTALTINETQNVGIGTTSPSNRLHISKSDSTAYDATVDDGQRDEGCTLAIENGDGTTNSFAQIAFDNADSNQSIARIVALRTGTSSSALTFVTEHGNTKSEKLRITSDGFIGCGGGTNASTPRGQFVINSEKDANTGTTNPADPHHFHLCLKNDNDTNNEAIGIAFSASSTVDRVGAAILHQRTAAGSVGNLKFFTSGSEGTTTESFRVAPNGDLTNTLNDTFSRTNAGITFRKGDSLSVTRNGGTPLEVNRGTNDGALCNWFQDNSHEGGVTVSGSTVSYNGGHLSRWSQLKGISKTDKSKRPTIYQGTVMSNLDDLCSWSHAAVLYTEEDKKSNAIPEGKKVGDVKEAAYTEENQQLNMTKVSDTVGDKNIAGVFYIWDDDDNEIVNDFYIAMTGDMVIRVAGSTTVARGDLLESAGDGTAKPQSDDIIRSKTIAKITSINATATYADGSKAYPCVLMAC